MKRFFILLFMICVLVLPVGFSYKTIQYQGCGFASYESPDEIPVKEVISINRKTQWYMHHEPCLKMVDQQKSSLFRYSSKIKKSSYVTCERVQDTNDYTCDRTDLSDEEFINPRYKSYSYTSGFTKFG